MKWPCMLAVQCCTCILTFARFVALSVHSNFVSAPRAWLVISSGLCLRLSANLFAVLSPRSADQAASNVNTHAGSFITAEFC